YPDTLGSALRGVSQLTLGLLQNGQEAMHTVGGLGLTQRALQTVHDLQRVGLLIDQNEQEFIGKAGERPLRSTTNAALACFALVGMGRGIRAFVSDLEHGQQALELWQR